MRKKLVTLFVALVVTGALAAGGGALGIRARADETATPAAAQTYGLYVKDELVTARGGKKMTAVSANDAVIKCVDGNGDGVTTDANRKVVSNGGSTGAYFSVASDTAYAFNAGIIGETPAGTTQYRTYGHSEIYFENYPGGVQRGGEWVLAEPVDTAEYSAFSLEIACGSNSAPAGDVNGDAFIYAMGKDAAGNDKIVNGKISFGVGYWSTGVFEWGELLASVDRIAVSVLWECRIACVSRFVVSRTLVKLFRQLVIVVAAQKLRFDKVRDRNRIAPFVNGGKRGVIVYPSEFVISPVSDKMTKIFHRKIFRHRLILEKFLKQPHRVVVIGFFQLRSDNIKTIQPVRRVLKALRRCHKKALAPRHTANFFIYKFKYLTVSVVFLKTVYIVEKYH